MATTKSSTSSKSKSTATKATYKPGETAGKDLKLFVKDSRGKTVGEINVPAGKTIPPSAKKKASSYEAKK